MIDSLRKSICLIGARKGSKRLPGKNRKILNGRPLYQYTLETAVSSQLFGDVIFTSDDESLLAELENYKGIHVDHRPEAYADDRSTMMDVTLYLIEKNPAMFSDATDICILTPCNPFRRVEHLVRAYHEFYSSSSRSLMSVTAYPFPIELAMDVVDHKISRNWEGPIRPAQFQNRYFANGAINLVDYSYFLEHHKFVSEDARAFIMGWPESIDIDTLDEFEFAKLIMENQYHFDR